MSRLELVSVSRGLALFFGAFALLNILGDLLISNFDANLWWIDLRWLPVPAADMVLLIGAAVLLAHGAGVLRDRIGGRIALGVVLTLLTVAVLNVLTFYVLLFQGTISSGFPVPLSAFVAAAMGAIVWVQMAAKADAQGSWAITVAVALACLVVFPLLQMACYGKTDYRRKADVAVVFGARVYADGTISDAAAERVIEAARVYNAGLVPVIVMSGGRGDGPLSEPEAMRDLAVKLGVPADAILLDTAGLNTERTVENTAALCRLNGWHRVLAISHAYHLPRVKMAFGRAGAEAYTVPVHSPYFLKGLPRYIAREVVALWGYYARPLLRGNA